MPVAPLDLAIITLVGFFAVRGIRRGFVHGVLDLVVLIVAVRVGALVAPRLVPLVEEVGIGWAAPAVALAVATVAVGTVCLAAIAVVGRPLRRLPVPPPLPFLDGLLGLGPGMLKGVVAAVVVVVPLVSYQDELGLGIGEQLRASRLAQPLYAFAQRTSAAATRQLGIELPPLDPTTGASPIELPLP